MKQAQALVGSAWKLVRTVDGAIDECHIQTEELYDGLRREHDKGTDESFLPERY